jgi:hypothetical protein
MKAISITPRSGQRGTGRSAVVLLHGHQVERSLAGRSPPRRSAPSCWSWPSPAPPSWRPCPGRSPERPTGPWQCPSPAVPGLRAGHRTGPRRVGRHERGRAPPTGKEALYQDLIPELATVTRSRRARDPRPRTATSTSGYAAATCPATAWSATKLSLPPRVHDRAGRAFRPGRGLVRGPARRPGRRAAALARCAGGRPAVQALPAGRPRR